MESSSGSRLLEVGATAVEVEAPGRRRMGLLMAAAARIRFASGVETDLFRASLLPPRPNLSFGLVRLSSTSRPNV
jgi:hypothetical protein